MKTISIKETLAEGWQALKANLPVFVAVGLVGLGIWMAEQIGLGIANASGSLKPFLVTVTNLAARLAQLWLQLVLIRMALKVVDGQPVSVDELSRSAPDFLSFLLASVLYSLVVTGGMILLIVPGVIWAVRYGLYGFVVANEHVDPVEALKRARVLSDGVRWELFVFGLALIGVNILGAMALGVGLLATIPITAVAAARVYRQLAARAASRGLAVPPAHIGRPAEVH